MRASARARIAALVCLMLAHWGPAPVGAASARLRDQLAQLEQLLRQWREPEALALAARLLQEHPKEGQVLMLQGEVLFRHGRYKEALVALDRALARGAPAARARGLRQRVAATQAAVAGHVSHRSPGGHFQILTPRGKDELLAHFAGETLEAIRAALKEDLGYAPPDRVRLEIYSGAEALSRVSSLTRADVERTGTIALCKHNRLMLVSPRALLQGYAWRDALAHEYAHLVISRASHNAVPIWLHEGLAKHLESRWRQPAGEPGRLSPVQEHLLAGALRSGRFISWERMYPSMAKLPNQRAAALAFAQVQTAVDFIARTAGPGALRGLLEGTRQGRGEWQVIQRVSGLTRARFNSGWRRHLRSLNLRPLAGLVPPELRFGKAPTREQRLAAVKHKQARRWLRLADLLRVRGHTRAAIIEYQKARQTLGPRDELVANHLARAYLEIASPAQAISALLPVLEYYPEKPGPQVTIGTAYLRRGDLGAAQKHLRVALRINPFNPEVHCGLARALGGAGAEAARHARICQQLGAGK